jgi:deoxyribose-phosphate aldolase
MSNSATLRSLARMIDHSVLHPTATEKDIVAGCKMGKKYHVATVCVKPYAIPLACKTLKGSDVGVCAVIAFPHGNSTSSIKAIEAESAVLAGATEIDMVVNIGKVLGGDWKYVSREIKAVNSVVVRNGGILKVIFENDYLEDRHIVRLCKICSSLAVAFVKTSTGYGSVKQKNGTYAYKGATERHLKLMRKHCPLSVGIKAAGGIRTLDELLKARKAGATRIGASATESIIREAKERGYQ